MKKKTAKATASRAATMKDERIVREVIRRYGEVIDLRETPYVLIEILRNYRSRLTPDDGGLPPGGVPPTPPGPASQRIDNSVLLKEILKLSRDVRAIKLKVRATELRRARTK